uniref:Uncharacterized protein n=1 Tax=Timema poppense TaxID=170557 RepID=A0A7R9D3X1_TIMPO|nr:unnamed protein product [Timema poppensis]
MFACLDVFANITGNKQHGPVCQHYRQQTTWTSLLLLSSKITSVPAQFTCYDSVTQDRGSKPVTSMVVKSPAFQQVRYVCWTAYLLRYHGKTGHVEPVPLPGAPFSHYYSQEASDEGIIMETDVTVKERPKVETKASTELGPKNFDLWVGSLSADVLTASNKQSRESEGGCWAE